MSHRIVKVEGPQPYDVVIGSGVASKVAGSLPKKAERVLVVHSEPLQEAADLLRGDIEAADKEVLVLEIPDAEAGKTSDVLVRCWAELGKTGFTRSDCVVGIGGGAVTDLAGFVAASWLRGIAIIQVPTSLLAMVDAAVGGKTGINTPEGKNLVGAFHAPLKVWCDVDMLRTLPREHLIAGFGEIVKTGFIRDRGILDIIDRNQAALRAGIVDHESLPILEELITLAVRVKADVVGKDFKETFLREILNYGHTLGHAIEQVEHYEWKHGEAISVGMVYAAELARLAGMLSDADVALHRRLIGGLGLPVSYPDGRWGELLEVMRRDKKTRGSVLRFVVLEGIGKPVRLEGPEESLLQAAYDAISD